MPEEAKLVTVVPRTVARKYSITIFPDKSTVKVVRESEDGGTQTAEVTAAEIFEALWVWEDGPWVSKRGGR